MRRSRLIKTLKVASCILLATVAAVVNLGGLVDGWLQPIGIPGLDIYQRFTEWRLFADGIYPMHGVASSDEMALPHFRGSVYPPWVFPVFGLVFSWAGYEGGKAFVFAASLLALTLIAWIGYQYLAPLGPWAALMGALSPLAILGNRFCFSHGQFSIICMGLISTQWLLISRKYCRTASIFWALAMIKPQIAFFFVWPLVRRGRWFALAMGCGTLVVLSVITFVHTTSSPIALWNQWASVLPLFVDSANSNLFAKAIGLMDRPVLVVAIAIVILVVSVFLLRRWPVVRAVKSRLRVEVDPMISAAACAVIGYASVYHMLYDKIMLYPLVLVCLKGVIQRPRFQSCCMAVAIFAIVWLPERILAVFPTVPGQTLVLLVLGFCIMYRKDRLSHSLPDAGRVS